MSEEDFNRSTAIVNSLLAEDAHDEEDPQVFLANKDWDTRT